MKKSMPTAIVVPSAKPKAKSVAAKAGTLKGMRGWNWRAALMLIFTVLQPNDICSKETRKWPDVCGRAADSNMITKNSNVTGNLPYRKAVCTSSWWRWWQHESSLEEPAAENWWSRRGLDVHNSCWSRGSDGPSSWHTYGEMSEVMMSASYLAD